MTKPIVKIRPGERASRNDRSVSHANGKSLHHSNGNGYRVKGEAVNGDAVHGKTSEDRRDGVPAIINIHDSTGAGACRVFSVNMSLAAEATISCNGNAALGGIARINAKGTPVLVAPSTDGTLASNRRSAMVQRDGRLIDRCLGGDVSAWSEIYREFHESLLVSIRRYLNRAGQDTNLVEEIAARVWYALVKNGFELLARFDVSRGCRLSTYLSVVAKNETRVLFRSERRRKSREQLASRPDICEEGQIETNQLMSDSEFLMTLSQAERAYFLDVLVAPPTDREVAERNYSTDNNWQLRHRIRKKLEQFISETDA